MNIDRDRLLALVRSLPRPATRLIERVLLSGSAVQAALEREVEPLLSAVEPGIHPYDARRERLRALPHHGRDRREVLAEVQQFAAEEHASWQNGFVSGAVYHGDAEHRALVDACYAAHSQSNPLHVDVFPSAVMFEEEVISMVAHLLGKGVAERTSEVCGTVTSGGTESILLAMKAYRDSARARGVRQPEIIAPVTAHVAFDKAAEYFGLRLQKVPVDEKGIAIVSEVRKAISRRTAVIVGSAPCFPYGAVDPIEEIAAIAVEHGVGCHVDACLGGFVLPFAEQLGEHVPRFDFRLRGVTSISIDTHKYGYAAKGTSVILYRTEELRRHQYFAATEWPGGLYSSATLAGSRSGGLSAACWAALTSIGVDGYREATAAILATASTLKAGIADIPELRVIGDPLFVIAIESSVLNIYEVLDRMTDRGWRLNGLQHPPAFHIAVTLRHTQPGVAERFLQDLQDAVQWVVARPGSSNGMAPVYGMAASMPFRGVVSDLLKRYIDMTYRSR